MLQSVCRGSTSSRFGSHSDNSTVQVHCPLAPSPPGCIHDGDWPLALEPLFRLRTKCLLEYHTLIGPLQLRRVHDCAGLIATSDVTVRKDDSRKSIHGYLAVLIRGLVLTAADAWRSLEELQPEPGVCWRAAAVQVQQWFKGAGVAMAREQVIEHTFPTLALQDIGIASGGRHDSSIRCMWPLAECARAVQC